MSFVTRATPAASKAPAVPYRYRPFRYYEEVGWRGYGENAIAQFHPWFRESLIFGAMGAGCSRTARTEAKRTRNRFLRKRHQ